MADAHIAADVLQDAADGQGGIQARAQQDLAHHGGGSGLAVGAADGDGGLVMLHDLAQKLAPGEAGEEPGVGLLIFRIVRVDGGGEDHAVNPPGLGHIFGPLSIEYGNPLCLQHLGGGAGGAVGAADLEARVLQQQRHAGHADAADAHEVEGRGMAEINCIHRLYFLVGFSLHYYYSTWRKEKST